MGWFTAKKSLDVIGKIGEVAGELFTSDEERMQLNNELIELKQKPLVMQALANITSATSRSTWVAGGRPALLWVAALGLFFYFPVRYAFGTLLWVRHSWNADKMLEFPFTGEGLMELVGMLLGLAAYRTVEKIKGAAK